MNLEGLSYFKVKGYSKTISLEILSNFIDLAYTKELVQTKRFKLIRESKINVDDNSNYKLQITDLKRDLIYENNKLVGTKSLKIDSNSKK